MITTLIEGAEDDGAFLYIKDPGPQTYRLIHMNTEDEDNDDEEDDEGLWTIITHNTFDIKF